MNTAILEVRGMSCQHCVQAIERAVGKLDGVREVRVDLASGRVTVTYEESAVGLDRVKAEIEDQGYEVA